MRALAAGLLAAATLAGPAGRVQAEEVRGLWVVRTGLVSPEEVDRVVDHAVAGGFNTLLVQVRGRGDAFYRSQLVPASPLLHGRNARFDPLAHLLERARAQHLKVHAWVNVLLTGHFGQPLPDVLQQHPEWAMVPRSAARAALAAKGLARLRVIAAASSRSDVEGYYLSPAVPSVGVHLEQVVRELVRRYPVDGLHLDFIRYPSVDFDYSRAALESFQRTQGSGDLLSGPQRAPAAWDEHRRSVLTALVERLSRAARSERSGLLVSAAVVPSDVEALNQKFQAWPTWVSRGIVDAVCPMAYTPDPKLFRAQIEQARELVGAKDLWAGVGAYRLSIDMVVQNIRSARALGASGVVLFSHESLDAASLQRLRKEAFDSETVAAR
jgi:uncharacterized lipoprotein YddW (UPF0748 family)